jgi:hypothetical protein
MHRQQAVGVDLEGHADAGRAGHHRRNAAQREARQAAAVGDQLAFALHHVQRHRGLAVLEGGEVLRARGGQAAVARDDLLDQPAHGFQAQRQRVHVQQQQAAVGAAAVAGQLVGLDRRAQRHRLVGVDAGAGFTAEDGPSPRLRTAACAWRRPPAPRRRHRPASGRRRAARGAPAPACARPGRASGRRTGRGRPPGLAAAVAARAAHAHAVEGVLSPSLALRAAACSRAMSGGPQPPPLAAANQAARRWSKSSPPSAGVAAGGHHLEHTACQAQHRHVEGAAAQVVDHEQAFAGAVQAVGHAAAVGSFSSRSTGRPARGRRPWWPGAGRRRSRPAR